MAFNNSNPSIPQKRSFWLSPGFLITAVLLVVLGFGLVRTIVGTINGAVTTENGIKAQSKVNQNNLASFTTKTKEALGVAKVNNAALNDIIKNSLTGRYGEGGSQQAMLWIKENYPGQYDPSMMKNVQQVIIAGRTDFEANQNILTDKVRIYENQLGYVWSGFLLHTLGYPKIKLEDYRPVLNASTEQAFKTKIDEGMDIK